MRRSKDYLKWKGSNGDIPGSFFGSFIKSFLTTIALLLIVGISVFVYIYSSLQPVDRHSNETVEVEIPIGTSLRDIATILEESGVVKNDLIFYYYVRFLKESNFQAGTYQLPVNAKASELVEQLKEGKVYADSMKITIPEGLKISEVGEILEEEGITTKESFLHTAETMELEHPLASYIVSDVEGRESRLEGFLFPETYEVLNGATDEEIIFMMMDQMQKELKEEWLQEIEKKGMSVSEILTLASLIEREAVVDEERKTISGVYYNRLEKDMKLQADATVQYALGKQKERILYEDLEVESPFNTYKYKGLPPAPIAIPGRESIEAAIYPEKHDYFYYVTKKDGSQTHYFAKTYEEHQQNIQKSKEN